MFLFKVGRVRSSIYRFMLLVLISLLGSGVRGQEKESYMLDSVNVTWEAARGFFKELGDVRSLLNNYTVLEIARDPILVDYMEGFKARNNIDMMTVSYIYGEQLWEKVFGDPKKKQFEQASGDLVKSRIVFERKAPKTSEGYYVYLEVKGGSTKVYEMFDLTEAEFDSVVNEHAAILGTNNTIYTDPGDAHESVIQALIGALSEIEGREFIRRDSDAADVQDSLIVEINHTATTDTQYYEIDSTLFISEDETLELASMYKNLEILSFIETPDSLNLDLQRIFVKYSLKDTLNLVFSKLELFRVDGIDSALIAQTTDLEPGIAKDLTDPIDESKGWNLSSFSDFFEVGDELVLKLTTTQDSDFKYGFTDQIGFYLYSDLDLTRQLIVKRSHDATRIGTKYVGNETSPVCNICVRSALLLLREDSALFSQEGSAYYDPDKGFKVRYPKGKITNPGRAKNIKEDFDLIALNPELNTRFSEINKDEAEGWDAYFQRLQDKADNGKLIVGAMLNSTGSSGHVMMITPGGLVSITNETEKWGKTFDRKGRELKKLPRVLECGTGARENEAPLCRNVDFTGATTRVKWFEYSF